MSRKIVIAMSGWKQSGKDTACDYIQEVLGENFNAGSQISSISRESFASPIRRIINDIFGVDEEKVTDKEQPLKETKFFFKGMKSYRELMILLGDDIFKKNINKNIWSYVMERHILQKFKETTPLDSVYIVSDVRFNSELKMLERLRKRGFEVYHFCVFRKEALPEWIKRGLNPTNPEDLQIIETDFEEHKAEYEWCASNPRMTDYITNDGSLANLKTQVEKKIVNRIWK